MARDKPPSFDFYPDDFVAGTMHLHPICIGIYTRLLCFQWSHGSIPSDRKQLVRVTGATEAELDEHLATVLEKFAMCADGLLRNPRLERERERKTRVSGARSVAAEARWNQACDANASANGNASEHANASANEYAKRMPPIRKKEVGSRKKEVGRKKEGGAGGGSPFGFDDFWKVYPRKKAKESAMKAYVEALDKICDEKSMTPTQAADWLLAATIERATELAGLDPQYQPYPASWLRAGGYHDEIGKPQESKSKSKYDWIYTPTREMETR